jgi:hypothetical protein
MDCGSTIGVKVANFDDMYSGPRYTEAKTGLSECRHKCQNMLELGRCDASCSMAYIREIMQIILHLKSIQQSDININK